jgi:hypothetical protein
MIAASPKPQVPWHGETELLRHIQQLELKLHEKEGSHPVQSIQQMQNPQKRVLQIPIHKPALQSVPQRSILPGTALAAEATPQASSISQQEQHQPKQMAAQPINTYSKQPQQQLGNGPAAKDTNRKAYLPLRSMLQPSLQQQPSSPHLFIDTPASASPALQQQSQHIHNVPASAGAVPLPSNAQSHFFLSHSQSSGGDQTNAIYLELQQLGFTCWYAISNY